MSSNSCYLNTKSHSSLYGLRYFSVIALLIVEMNGCLNDKMNGGFVCRINFIAYLSIETFFGRKVVPLDR